LKINLLNDLKTNEAVVYKNAVTTDTVNAITTLIKNSRNIPFVRESAEDIIRYIPEKSWNEEITAVFEWVKSNMHYTKDYPNVEYIKTPERHLRDIQERGLAFGDCDDHVTLLGSLLYSIGYITRIVIIQSKWNTEGGWNHVYLYVNMPFSNNWVALDATAKDKPMGWESEFIKRKIFEPIGV